MPRRKLIWVIALVLVVTASVAWSQRQRSRRPRQVFDFSTNPEVDERKFTFVRLKFTMKNLRYNQVWEPPWAHDIPRAERHLMQIIKDLTGIEPNDEGIVLALDDPEIFKYPFAYICEVGFLDPTEAELEGLREYIRRGGFMIVDDFGDNWWWANDWGNFESVMKRAFPDKELKLVDVSYPLFHSFFDMKTITFPNYRGNGKYYVLEDDAGRVSMIVNFDNDIGDYWEWSGTGYLGVDLTNEAFKLGVNYIVYSLAH